MAEIDSQSGKTLSLKCPCGYVKHDLMHLGIKQGKWEGTKKPLNYCGGLVIVNESQQTVTCKLCGFAFKSVELHCSFCGKQTFMPVNYKEDLLAGRITVLQMSVHKTVVYLLN